MQPHSPVYRFMYMFEGHTGKAAVPGGENQVGLGQRGTPCTQRGDLKASTREHHGLENPSNPTYLLPRATVQI